MSVKESGGIFGMMFREVGFFWEQVWNWAEEQAKADREQEKIDQQRRLAEAQARLLEQIRLAKEAGLDVDRIMATIQQELKK
ncbi:MULTISPECIES: hypothetical protein [Chloroflexus]|jgi:hypothetical protein|uniref:Uncharacterized protein n=2 Tax=Chloroflexus aurantiacus TaxID=1108 RepID=A9W9Q3_CHLAA|nr:MULTISPECIES: hypothetical protein [Chloroflexus]RMG52206.1 MAG: hypothetical protein D6716_04105 [Chloroflexota bacterium]AAN85641.1 chlorosome basal plate protein [Chloroflexus aurantiacus J-10-fl]ABY34539.1 hypothetical protein Caur_1311 [Chloroflexus aurantiacus J-10-fl]GIV93962.1 MAG: hypothetical protein KatS3mg056_2671 [Chloroflexus sp.]HBW69515.1 hypothetical protein [Chloroflexus aurantiacus]